MILFFENGRLGNQLFQYCGLKKYFKHHTIVIFGCEELSKTFDKVEAIFLNKNKFYKKVQFILLKNLFSFLSKIFLIGKIAQSNENKNFNLIISKGIFSNIFFVHDVFFQHDECHKNIKNYPILKNKYIDIAKSWMIKNKLNKKKSNLVFVHIRRGDYLYWPSLKYPAVIDLKWYLNAIKLIKKKINNPKFILMGDDIKYIKKHFKQNKNLFISNNDLEIDMCIMHLCSHGILSPSSFAWWGAYLGLNKKKNYRSLYFAPKYWFNYNQKKWNYQSINSSNWITFIN